MLYYQQCDVVLCHALCWCILLLCLALGDIGRILSRGDASCNAPRRGDVGYPLDYSGDVPSEIREFHTFDEGFL